MATAARTMPKFVVGFRLCTGRGVGIKGCIIGAQANYIVGVLVHFNRAKHTPITDNATHKLQESKVMGCIVLTFNSVSGTRKLEQRG